MGKFSVNVSKWAKTTGQTLEQTVRAVEMEMFSRIIVRSPVDTGRFRGNWFVDQRLQTENTDKSGATTIAKMTQDVLASKVGGVTSFINTLPYSERLEFGYSKQAPAGMLRLTAAEFGAVVDDEANKNRV
jgi:hypothetical protein